MSAGVQIRTAEARDLDPRGGESDFGGQPVLQNALSPLPFAKAAVPLRHEALEGLGHGQRQGLQPLQTAGALAR